MFTLIKKFRRGKVRKKKHDTETFPKKENLTSSMIPISKRQRLSAMCTKIKKNGNGTVHKDPISRIALQKLYTSFNLEEAEGLCGRTV